MTTDGDGLFPGPCLSPGGEPDGLLTFRRTLTEEEFAHLKARWERKRHGHPKVLGLPRRVRLRLAAESAVNHAGTWLVYHGHYDTARQLWRLFGMWGK